MSQSQGGEREARQDEVVEIDSSWGVTVLRNIEMSRQLKRPTGPSIFKVPAILRSWDPDAYVPKLVSIGPYHRGNPSLQAMEEIKWQILDHLLSKAPKNSIHQYLKKMQDLEAKARSYYSEIIYMESQRFAEMLLLDGCFIIQLFIPYWNMRKVLLDLLNNNVFLETYLFQDLLLLENQLPYFIINDLLSMLDIPGLESFTIQTLIRTTLVRSYQFPSPTEPAEDFDVAHILHLFYKSITRSSGPQSGPQSPSPDTWHYVAVPSATELQEAGVKIKVSKAVNFLDISFNKKKGLLEIPAIRVYDFTNFIFRNLIALEQCHVGVGSKITNYSVFMDSIINTERDVALLSQEGIILRGYGSDTDIALLFSKLCMKAVVSKKNHLAQVHEEVNDYCNSRWNKWRARLMHDYFSNPWAIISVIAAAVLLVLAIVQTLFSLLRYAQQINGSDRPHP